MKYFKQKKEYTCGLACLRMILSDFDEIFSEEEFFETFSITELGLQPGKIGNIAKNLGYKSKISKENNINELEKTLNKSPVIVLINLGLLYRKEPTKFGHFIVVKAIKDGEVIVNDPAPIIGGENKKYPLEIFKEAWNLMDSWIIEVRK